MFFYLYKLLFRGFELLFVLFDGLIGFFLFIAPFFDLQGEFFLDLAELLLCGLEVLRLFVEGLECVAGVLKLGRKQGSLLF